MPDKITYTGGKPYMNVNVNGFGRCCFNKYIGLTRSDLPFDVVVEVKRQYPRFFKVEKDEDVSPVIDSINNDEYPAPVCKPEEPKEVKKKKTKEELMAQKLQKKWNESARKARKTRIANRLARESQLRDQGGTRGF
ncbi:MAG: hypothetical protein M0R00_01405 [Candidatus Omnitrophica bacterium]|jgi:hypothetical protein|nr:hypothetical protein [Candidatus Omnitrophota bacterium]